MSELTMDYIAGLFDAKGLIGIYKGSGAYYLRVSLFRRVSSETLKVMKQLEKMFGGGVSTFVNCHGYDCCQWQISTAPALAFLEALVPYLKIKRKQADLAIKWHRSIEGRERVHRSNPKAYTIIQRHRTYDAGYAMRLKALKIRPRLAVA